MKLQVTNICLDFETNNDSYKVKDDEQIEIENDCKKVYEVESENDLSEKISKEIGWRIHWVDYKQI
tara:strand:+ start:471 stop:668 length:198 start_codon:yes stop_codon:yes gene_type:complete